MEKVGVVIVAAGRGTRMGTAESKQFLPIGGKPILFHTLEAFQRMACVDHIVVVVGEQDVDRCRTAASQHAWTKITDVVSGGAERQHSVYKGLLCLEPDTEWVMVHDGVRPFVTESEVLDCLQAARQSGAAVLAVPVKDTIKQVDADGFIVATPDRNGLWAIQTPQIFRLAELKEAHEAAMRDGFLGTDDAMLVERMGKRVRIAKGRYTNIKITTPEDLAWANYWLANQEEGEST